ncbi:MAG: SDR family NAD(P)-dependent oxidoreductase [Dehalococcoidia bacterium]|jgi:NAD(P)-dependent dehydrogenase (short-subunit alcohol dehydrogenase family)|nr:SDR family NAD(P)-dependent oxidoreductase [Dehalococcoidia bacterium]
MNLDGKVAIVTGGSRGIGRAVCVGLGARGVKVVVAARTEADTSAGRPFVRFGSGTIGDTAGRIFRAGGAALAVRCDVTEADDLRRLVEATLDRFGRLDIVVANAGVDCESPVVDLDVGLLHRCLSVNVRGPLLLCK